MTITHGYTDLSTFKSYLGNNVVVSASDTLASMAVTAASRAIDAYCNRSFWLDASATPRRYTPKHLTRIDFDDDLGSTSDLVIATDASGDGTFETTWSVSDFELLPVNAPYGVKEAEPWTGMQAVGGKTLPWLVNTWLTRYDRVQITGHWGWPAVPDLVVQACLIKAAAIYHRRNTPQGIAAFGDFAAVRISRQQDPDVAEMLEDYRKQPVLVA